MNHQDYHLTKSQCTTMCMVHKSFRGLRAVSPVSVLGGNLIGTKLKIPYAPYHLPVEKSWMQTLNERHKFDMNFTILNNGVC